MRTIVAVAIMALLTLSVNGKGMLILQCGSDWCDSGAAATPKFEDFKVKLTGVAVVSANAEADKGVTPLPPQTRVVVTPGNEALFYLEYSFPTNFTPLMFLLANFDDKVGETGFRKGGAKPYAEHLLDIKKKR